MKRLLVAVLSAAMALTSCVPAYSAEYDVRERPMESISEILISDCADHGYIVATDEVGQWALRYYTSNVRNGTLTHEFTPEEVQTFDELRTVYTTMKDLYLPEMCKSVIDKVKTSEDGVHWDYVEK
jgi:hypothetical protein